MARQHRVRKATLQKIRGKLQGVERWKETKRRAQRKRKQRVTELYPHIERRRSRKPPDIHKMRLDELEDVLIDHGLMETTDDPMHPDNMTDEQLDGVLEEFALELRQWGPVEGSEPRIHKAHLVTEPLPDFTFKRDPRVNVYYADNAHDGEVLLNTMILCHTDITVVGMDTEFHTKGDESQKRTALIQICTGQCCILLHVAMYPEPMRKGCALERLLNSPSIRKVGVSLWNDLEIINKTFRLRCCARSVIEISHVYAKPLIKSGDSDRSAPGLKFLGKKMFGISYWKSGQWWDSSVISPENVQYAVSDAWLPLLLYHSLNPMRKAGIPGTKWERSVLLRWGLRRLHREFGMDRHIGTRPCLMGTDISHLDDSIPPNSSCPNDKNNTSSTRLRTKVSKRKTEKDPTPWVM
jgi:hypothetical protein